MRLFCCILLLIGHCAIAQVTDNFSDGDFTANPTWNGDNSEFTVNSSQELQLNNTVAGASYLSTASPGSSLDNIEWSFYIKQTFAPSSSNYGKVYLASDQANLEGSLNGYYLLFGEAGSTDAVKLYKQAGTTTTLIASGNSGEIAASFAIGVRVTRNASALWSIYVDVAGGTAYSFEASGTDAQFTSTSFFGVSTIYTASNSNKFFFDNFYVGPIVVDVTPPSIVSATATSATALDVLFSEAVDLTTSQTANNYSVNNGIGVPTTATRDGVNLSLVHLTFSGSFTNGLANTLTVNNVQDLNSNAISSGTTSFTYTTTGTPTFKDVIINEIFADPSPQIGLPNVEFVELYNKSSSPFNLNGWKLTDGSSTATLGNYTLLPNQYLIVCPVADTASFTPFGNRMGVSSFPSLNNTGDNLILKDNSLTTIDSVSYSDTWYQDATKKQGGWTLELINPILSSNCAAAGNWIASIDAAGGTPGTQNSVYSTAADVTAPSIASVTVIDSVHINVCFSEPLDASVIGVLSNYSISNGVGAPVADTVSTSLYCVYLTLGTPLIGGTTYLLSTANLSDCSGNALTPNTFSFAPYQAQPFDIVINELLPDPEPIVSLSSYEYLELHNRTNYDINLNNWKLYLGTTLKTLPNVTIYADSFLVITTTTALPDYGPAIQVIGLSSLSLTNSGATVTLKNPSGSAIHSVTYSDSWYQSAAKANGGWSLEQIDPNNPCGGSNNWTASVHPYGGTPGRHNSVLASNPDVVPPQLVRVSVIDTDTIRLYFNEPLDSTTMLNPSTYSIDNGIGSPTFIQPVAPDYKSVLLVVATLQPTTIYHITVNNSVTDCVGNTIGADNTAPFALPEPAAPNDIVINEVLADPKTGGVDFVEIYNRSNKVIDLKTLSISQYDTISNMPLSISNIAPDGYLLFPQDYLVLSVNGGLVKSHYTTTNPKGFLDLTSFPTLNISSGTVCLSTSTDIIDLLIYDSKMHFGLLNSTKGVSLERIDFNRPTSDRTNWHSASAVSGYATPAYKNSQYIDAGESDNAVEITPEVFSPDEDGINDVVNINYSFDAPGFVGSITIYDSKGIAIRHLIRSELLGLKGTFSWDGLTDGREKARIGIYILFFEAFDLSGTVKQYKKTCVLGTKL